jgi:hypothetical protein
VNSPVGGVVSVEFLVDSEGGGLMGIFIHPKTKDETLIAFVTTKALAADFQLEEKFKRFVLDHVVRALAQAGLDPGQPFDADAVPTKES